MANPRQVRETAARRQVVSPCVRLGANFLAETTMAGTYDFEQHRTRAYRDYAAVRDRYVRYASTIEAIL